jgi:hypothetical protein
MRSFMIPVAAAGAVLCVGAVPAAALTSAAPSVAEVAASGVTPVGYSHRRPYYRVRVPRYSQQGWVPRHLRGFEDPGYAYHGNINGCVVDLGYGRWESCNVGR